jgi:hypothetical protein
MGTPRLTRVSEIYDTLFDQYRAQPEIDGRFLVDGATPLNDYADYVIMFGYRPNAAQWVTVDREATAGLAANDIETIVITVLVAAVDPLNNMRAARAKATEKLAALERIVTSNPTLGLTGVKAAVDSHAWVAVHSSKGAECIVTVDLRIEVTL